MKMNKVKPNEDDERYLSNRNDRLVQNIHRTMDHERRISGDAGGHGVPYPYKKPEDIDTKPEETTKKEEESSSSSSRARIDAVVFVIVLAQLMGYVAIALAIYGYTLDQQWNQILNGNQEVEEVGEHTVLKGKTYNLEGHDYLVKAKEYATRSEPLEIIFIIILLIICVASLAHVMIFYILIPNLEDYSALHIGINAAAGALAIFVSAFLVTSATNIENSYSYAADMLHNFQHAFDSSLPVSDPSLCKDGHYIAGCPTYEHSKKQAKDLENILRLCADGSRFTRYYRSHKHTILEIKIQGEIYTRAELKLLGFCSRDGFKITASVFAVIMGVLFSVVPIIYCCETSSDNEPDELTDIPDHKPLPTVHGRHVQNIPLQPPPPPPQPKRNSDPGNKAGPSAPAPPTPVSKKIVDPDTRAWLKKFISYIENNSD